MHATPRLSPGRRFRVPGAVLLLAAIGTPAGAQQPEAPPIAKVAQHHDTGWVPAPAGRPTDAARVILSYPLQLPGARWLRLNFASIDLGEHVDGVGATLRIESYEDGAVQILDAAHCRQWRNASAYFNGDMVQVEVLARPGSTPSRLVLQSLDVGMPPPLQAQLPCASNDDRVLSNDSRVGRLMTETCTAWLIDDCEHCLLTAAHCLLNLTLVQFNVPLSDVDGSLNHPNPLNQYAIDFESLQSNEGQVGLHDWAYFGVFPNPITGKTPFEAQGASFTLLESGFVSGDARVRVTGYGSDSSPSSHNEVQQTNLGPILTTSQTALSYEVDNAKGNSGSPVIWEDHDLAVGIHTTGGCLGDTLIGSGTAISHPDLQAALADPQGVCDPEFTSIDPASLVGWLGVGFGLKGTHGVPQLTGNGPMQPNVPVTLSLSGALGNTTTTLVVGGWAIHAPFKFGVLVPHPHILAFDLPTDASGALDVTFPWLPHIPSGVTIWWQFWIDDPEGLVGYSASNAVAGTTP